MISKFFRENSRDQFEQVKTPEELAFYTREVIKGIEHQWYEINENFNGYDLFGPNKDEMKARLLLI